MDTIVLISEPMPKEIVDMMNETKKYRLAYWGIGLALIIWVNVAIFVDGSEATFVPVMLLIMIAIPVSLVANILGSFFWLIFPNDFPYINVIASTLYALFILLTGYLQWFYFIPWVIRKLKE